MLLSFLLIIVLYLFCLPKNLFKVPLSTVIEDKDGRLLGAKIADDGQWRFPYSEEVPEKFVSSITCFEDQYFFKHPGVNPVSLTRAFVQNIKAKKIVSGGSTITMQVIRISRNKPRTIYQKLIETILATRLELRCSKKEILAMYASNAPFGGNVVGLDAASWRYFGRKPDMLSWAETATLAVLPNSPALIHPGRNRDLLLSKRNRLLKKLQQKNFIDSLSYELALLEPLPDEPYPIPQLAPHLLDKVYLNNKGHKVRTSIDDHLQIRTTEIVNSYSKKYIGNGIYNAAAIIIDVETGKVLAYVGNTNNKDSDEHGNDVDIITSPRSSGSILKPYLFAGLLDQGDILPNTLIPDIPTHISGFSPENYNHSYDGAVKAKNALARSLNIPAVRMLQKYGLEKFHFLLKKLGLTTIIYPPNHYGLTLILGGAETKLYDLAGVFASMSRTLNHYYEYDGMYNKNDFRPPSFVLSENDTELVPVSMENNGLINASAIYLTYDALIEVNRPDESVNWKMFSSSKRIAWKTGTSYGNRDAWAIGTTPDYVVGVWVGNADGEGRPGLTGVSYAAPIMLDIFDLLPNSGWFKEPVDEMIKIPVCKKSGYRAGSLCTDIDSILIPKVGLRSSPCPYEVFVHLDKNRKYRVNSNCMDVNDMIHEAWFVLPPAIEYYYQSKHPGYRTLPPLKSDCFTDDNQNPMDMIYPKETVKIYIPYELDGTRGKTVFEVAHRKTNSVIYWHLDDNYIGSTKEIHQMGLSPQIGKHTLTLVDEDGYTLSKKFEILDKGD